MREIEFRGKAVYNDIGWVYGSLITSMKGIIPCIITDVGVGDKNDLDYKFEYVDSKTISQFTGLCDKNGVKIFEGDIVSYCVRNIGFVDGEFDTSIERHIGTINYKGSRFYIVGEKEELNLDFILDELNLGVHDPFQRNSYELKVIGNIYDNPELLEEEE